MGGAAPDVRVSDAERERAINVLRDAAAEGRLGFEELADRIDVAVRARTRAELEPLTVDLPIPEGTISGHELVAPSYVSTVFGDVRRLGAWKVPAGSSWRSLFGDIVLDLREGAGHRARGDDRRRHDLR